MRARARTDWPGRWHGKPTHSRRPERISSDGAWTDLFRKSPGYISTDLYHETATRCYLTIDRWKSKSSFDDLKRLWHDDYLTLNGRCSCLIDSEWLIGEIES